jgi:hypothetical protein
MNTIISDLEKANSKNKVYEKEISNLINKVGLLQRDIDKGKEKDKKLVEKNESLEKELIIRNNQLEKMNEGYFIPKENNSVCEFDEADKILNNILIEPNTFSVVKSQLSLIGVKFADYKLNLNSEILKTREYFIEETSCFQEKSEKEIVENALKLFSLSHKLKRLTNLEIGLKRKEDEFRDKLAIFKELLGI